MSIVKALFKIEFKKLLKTPVIVMFGIIAPIGMFMLQASMFKSQFSFGDKSVHMIDMALPMFALMSIAVLGVGNVGAGLSYTRIIKFLKRLRLTPVKSIHYIVALFLVQLIVAVLTIVGMLGVASLGYSVSLMAHNLLIFSFILLIAYLMCFFIGIFVGSVSTDPKVSQSVSMTVYFVLIFLGGFTFPIELMPKPMQIVSYLLPTTHAVKVLEYAWNGMNIFTDYHMLVMCLVTLVFSVFSIKFFRFE